MSKQKRLKIGIDAHVVDGIYQGSRTHSIELFSRVVKLLPEIDFFFFLADPSRLLEASPLFSLPNSKTVRMPHRNSVVRLAAQLPGLAKKYGLDLLHCQYIVPPNSPCPTAVTIHDILFEAYPEFFTRFFVFRSRLLMRASARRSLLVFSVSEFSRQELVNRYRLKSEKVVTIYNGANTESFHPLHGLDPALDDLSLTTGNYILTVGRLEPRKNHVRLLEAYRQLAHPKPKLVIVGQRDFGFDAVIALIQEESLRNDVLLLESVDDALLPVLYRNAAVFVYPSLAEGFGMPVVEAMSSGVPVITSRGGALREVGGEAALFVDPTNIDSIVGAITGLLRDEAMRRELSARGVRRAAEFTWDASAERVASQYCAALNSQA